MSLVGQSNEYGWSVKYWYVWRGQLQVLFFSQCVIFVARHRPLLALLYYNQNPQSVKSVSQSVGHDRQSVNMEWAGRQAGRQSTGRQADRSHHNTSHHNNSTVRHIAQFGTTIWGERLSQMPDGPNQLVNNIDPVKFVWSIQICMARSKFCMAQSNICAGRR